MSTEAETGIGSEFWLANESNVLTLLGEVLSVPVPNGTTALIDVSHMKTVGFKDYINAPLKDGEEADLDMNWIPGSQTDQLCIWAKGKRRAFKIVVPVNGEPAVQWTGEVLVRDYIRQNPMETQRTGKLRVKWVGEIVEASV